jgi:hypothetical protein
MAAKHYREMVSGWRGWKQIIVSGHPAIGNHPVQVWSGEVFCSPCCTYFGALAR